MTSSPELLALRGTDTTAQDKSHNDSMLEEPRART